MQSKRQGKGHKSITRAMQSRELMTLTAAILGEYYTTYECSPPVSGALKQYSPSTQQLPERGRRGRPSECDNKYHSDDAPVVALSTGWYSGGSRCLKDIVITANGKSVTAMVVDECDSTMQCDGDRDYQECIVKF